MVLHSVIWFNKWISPLPVSNYRRKHTYIDCSFSKLFWGVRSNCCTVCVCACIYFQMWPLVCLRMIWCSVRMRTRKSSPMDWPLTPNSKHLLLRDSSTSTGWLDIIQEGMLCRGFICLLILSHTDCCFTLEVLWAVPNLSPWKVQWE